MGVDSPVEIAVLDGKIQEPITILHNRSIAEDVEVLDGGSPYTGTLTIDQGAIVEAVELKGYSLIHSASLTAEAFTRSVMGDLGRPVVALVLLLFAHQYQRTQDRQATLLYLQILNLQEF